MYVYGIQDFKNGKTTTAYKNRDLAHKAILRMGFRFNGTNYARSDGRSVVIQRILIIERHSIGDMRKAERDWSGNADERYIKK